MFYCLIHESLQIIKGSRGLSSYVVLASWLLIYSRACYCLEISEVAIKPMNALNDLIALRLDFLPVYSCLSDYLLPVFLPKISSHNLQNCHILS